MGLQPLWDGDAPAAAKQRRAAALRGDEEVRRET
jgi:hypothetical protein